MSSTKNWSARSLAFFFSLLLLGLLPAPISAGTATAANQCSFSVWCAIVEECSGDCPATFQEVKPNNWISTNIFGHGIEQGMTIMCGKSSNPNEVSQLEWTRNEKMLHFDLSNVKGAVFLNDGMSMSTSTAMSSALPTCKGAVCSPGQSPCPGIYNEYDDDEDGMRACAVDASIIWRMCAS